MIKPVFIDQEFLTDVSAANRPDDGLRLWWLGQSGFLLQYRQQHLLFDPYLSDSLTRKYADSDRPHLRMTERVVAPERLNFIDAILCSHQHTDHLDGDTLVPVLGASPNVRVVVPRAHRQLAATRCQVDEERLDLINAGQSLELGSFRIHAVTAAHDLHETDIDGQSLFLGYVVQCGAWTIYHAGDTVLHDGLIDQLCEFAIDIAILPINGSAPSRHVSGNLWGDEAAELASKIQARLAIPCHYDMFSFNTTTPDLFVRSCHRLNQPYAVLQAGSRFDCVSIR